MHPLPLQKFGTTVAVQRETMTRSKYEMMCILPASGGRSGGSHTMTGHSNGKWARLRIR